MRNDFEAGKGQGGLQSAWVNPPARSQVYNHKTKGRERWGAGRGIRERKVQKRAEKRVSA